jgi:hypothetical protein
MANRRETVDFPDPDGPSTATTHRSTPALRSLDDIPSIQSCRVTVRIAEAGG